MTRILALTMFLAGPAAAQPPAPQPVFEAASIKPADPAAHGSSWNTRPGRITASNQTLRRCIMIAYDLKDYQVAGGPKWMNSEAYDIVAKLEDQGKPPTGKEIDAQIRLALQALLAERFHLEVHRETRPMPAYTLVVAKNGFKLQPVEPKGGSSTNTGRGRLTATGISMERMAGTLSSVLDRPVVDNTGITGVFDLKLEWSPDENQETSLDKPAAASIFTAIQEQLGLRLEAHKTDVSVIVVDRADKPSEN